MLFLRETTHRASGDPEITRHDVSPRPRRIAVAAGWWSRLRQPGFIAFIGLVIAYKFGDSMGSAITGPFMSDAGMTLKQIALIKGTLSSLGALGAVLGGWLAYRFGRRNALLFAGITSTLSLVLYIIAAMGTGGFPMLAAASIAEHILGGAATVALFTLMMDASDRGHASSDYTLLACAVVVAQGISGLTAGIIGDLFGYPTMFGTSVILSAAGCVVLIVAIDRRRGPARLQPIWRRQSVPTQPIIPGPS